MGLEKSIRSEEIAVNSALLVLVRRTPSKLIRIIMKEAMVWRVRKLFLNDWDQASMIESSRVVDRSRMEAAGMHGDGKADRRLVPFLIFSIFIYPLLPVCECFPSELAIYGFPIGILHIIWSKRFISNDM
jgi:hypothetical protein